MLYSIHCADVPFSIPLFLVKYKLLCHIFIMACSVRRVLQQCWNHHPGRLVITEKDGRKMKCKKWLKASQPGTEREMVLCWTFPSTHSGHSSFSENFLESLIDVTTDSAVFFYLLPSFLPPFFPSFLGSFIPSLLPSFLSTLSPSVVFLCSMLQHRPTGPTADVGS